MKEVQLTQGKVAIIDDADFDLVSKYKWYYAPCGYAARGITVAPCRRTIVYMHRQLLDASSGIVDHINRNKLDNRRANLRLGDKVLNSINRPAQCNNKLGHRGITVRRGLWRARIKLNGVSHELGRFCSLDEAVEARKRAETAYLNSWARPRLMEA